MTNAFQTTSSPILLIGLLIAAAVAVRAFLDRTYVPALVGFIGLGILLGLADDRFDILSEEGHAALDILAELGIVALLFRVGLESDIAGLRRQLGRASFGLDGQRAPYRRARLFRDVVAAGLRSDPQPDRGRGVDGDEHRGLGRHVAAT